MGIFNFLKGKNESAKFTEQLINKYFVKPKILKVVTKITEKSLAVLEMLDNTIKKDYKTNKIDYLQKRVEIFFELVCFSLHLTNRIAYKELGNDNNEKLNEIIIPLLIEFAISHFYKQASENILPDTKAYHKKYRKYLDVSLADYSECKTLLLKPEDDIAFADKQAAGWKSSGLVNRLTDEILYKKLENYNPITYLKIIMILSELGKMNEMKKLVMDAKGEL
ncbi:MAG TPA: hypothetical protein VIK14_02605 [Ignavibacteria bacterium]